MAFVSHVIIFFTFCGYLRADFSSYYCSPPEATCGPFIPPMPRSYVVKLESTEPLENRTSYSVEYYDADNWRGTLISYHEGEETRIIYNVKANTLITVRGGTNDEFKECDVRSLMFDGDNLIFGWKNADGTKSKYFDVGGALFHYLPQLRFQYINFTSNTVRGMSANRWTGCIYLPQVDGTFKIDYYWSNVTDSTPSGEGSVPLKTVVEGRYLPDPTNKTDYKDVDVINHVVWFQSNPDLSDEIFEPPRGVFCTNDVDKTPFPTFPQSFSVSVEEVTDKGVENYDVWYDLQLQLIRIDQWTSNNDIIYIHDYKTGVVYTINKYRSSCETTTLNSDKNPIPKASDIFSINPYNFEYLGKYTVRDRLCGTWAGLMPDNISVSEWSFLDGSWHESQDDGSVVTRVPVQTILSRKNSTNSKVTREVKNYFNFVTDPNDFPFDIGSCFSSTDRKLFQVAFPGDSVINPRKFGDNFRFTVSRVIHVSPLRLSNVQVDHDINASRIFVEFTILSQLNTQSASPDDVSLHDALINLKNAVQNIGIIIGTGLPSNEKTYIIALPDSFLELDIDDPCKSEGQALTRKRRSASVKNDDSSLVDKYSTGQLVGLGFGLFFLGLILGIAAMMLKLIRLKSGEIAASNSDDMNLELTGTEEISSSVFPS